MAPSTSFENPLMPHARLRQMYLAVMRLHTLAHSLSARQRSGVLGREACLVAASIDLVSGDLISDTLQGTAIRFLRGAPLHRALNPAVRSRARGVLADCGAAWPLVPVGGPADRLWAALGAASALQASAGSGPQRNVVVAFLRSNEAQPTLLRRVFQFAGEHALPVVFVTMPASGASDKGNLSALSHRLGVPGIAVDAHDAVAIYRVMQESLGRARAGGGPALVDCIPFVLHRNPSAAPRQTNAALAAIERYILERNVVTPDWIAREGRTFARHLAQPVH